MERRSPQLGSDWAKYSPISERLDAFVVAVIRVIADRFLAPSRWRGRQPSPRSRWSTQLRVSHCDVRSSASCTVARVSRSIAYSRHVGRGARLAVVHLRDLRIEIMRMLRVVVCLFLHRL